MRKVWLLIGLITVGLIGGWVAGGSKETEENINPNIIRFHVRANSDRESDQALKKKVRNAVLEKFSNLSESESIEQTRVQLKGNLKAIEHEAARVIAQNGKNYPVRVEYGYADFPLKSYGQVTYPAGKYEAVQIIIGEGKGQNWWCVLYPPLCFVDISTSLAHSPALAAPVVQNNQLIQEVKPVIKFRVVEMVKGFFAKIKL